MSELQTEEKHDIQYKANRELIWGVGFLVLANVSSGDTWILITMGVFGLISLATSFYHNSKL